jgi:SAM-dependent methyltransferase
VALLPRLLHAVAENGSLRRDTLFQPVLHGGRGLSGQGKGNPAAAEHVVGRVQEGQHPAIAQVIHRLIDALLHHDRRHAVFHRPGQNFLVGIHTAAADRGRQNGKIPGLPGKLLAVFVHDLVKGEMLKSFRKFRVCFLPIHCEHFLSTFIVVTCRERINIPSCLDIFSQYCYDVGNVEEGLPVGGFSKNCELAESNSLKFEGEKMERKDAIRNAYRMTGSGNFYDGMITCSTLRGKAVCRLVWDMNKAECDDYLEKALSGIPENFSVKLLEVPVGTGILTMPVYRTLPNAEITCLDYSPDMMGQAREKAERLNLTNVSFQQGDVGALPYENGTFDIVLSLNGFHAFPDKEAAYREVFRVLKPGGTFCGCFYVAGECRRTDRLIRKVYEPMKFFTPPYETVSSLKTRLGGMYADAEVGNLKSIAWFVCHKGADQ